MAAEEHDHQDVEELHQAYLAARQAYRVALRVHLEEVHGTVPGRRDPERLHSHAHQ